MGGLSILRRPADKPLRGPLDKVLMGLGHVLGNGGVVALHMGSPVAGNASALVEDLDSLRGKADIDLFFDKLVGNGVVMPFRFDMVINMDPGLFPLGIDIGIYGKGFKGGPIEGFIEGSP